MVWFRVGHNLLARVPRGCSSYQERYCFLEHVGTLLCAYITGRRQGKNDQSSDCKINNWMLLETLRPLFSCLPSLMWVAIIIIWCSFELSSTLGSRGPHAFVPFWLSPHVESGFGGRLRTTGKSLKGMCSELEQNAPWANTFLPVPFVTCGTARGESAGVRWARLESCAAVWPLWASVFCVG